MQSVDFEIAFMLFCQEKLPGCDLPIKTWNDTELKDTAGKGGTYGHTHQNSLEDLMVNCILWCYGLEQELPTPAPKLQLYHRLLLSMLLLTEINRSLQPRNH